MRKRIAAHSLCVVRGDSMIGAHIVDGDIVILEDAKDVHDGDIVAALIDGETTLKRYVVERGQPISQGGKPALPGFGSGPRTEDSRRDGIAGSEAERAGNGADKEESKREKQAISQNIALLLYCFTV